MKAIFRWIATVALVLAAALPVTEVLAADATIKFEATNVGIGVRIEWGEGTLTLEDGSTHTFSVEGLKLVGVGYAKVAAQGEVSNLKNLKDFNGTYSMAGASGAVVSGKSYSIMANEAGVEIKLKADQDGVQLSAGGGGLTFKLKE